MFVSFVSGQTSSNETVALEAPASVVLFEQLYSYADRTNFAVPSSETVAFGVCPEAKVITKYVIKAISSKLIIREESAIDFK